MQVIESTKCNEQNNIANKGLEGEILVDAIIDNGNDTLSVASKDGGEHEVDKIVHKGIIGTIIWNPLFNSKLYF